MLTAAVRLLPALLPRSRVCFFNVYIYILKQTAQHGKSEQVRKGWEVALPVPLYTFAPKSKNLSHGWLSQLHPRQYTSPVRCQRGYFDRAQTIP